MIVSLYFDDKKLRPNEQKKSTNNRKQIMKYLE